MNMVAFSLAFACAIAAAEPIPKSTPKTTYFEGIDFSLLQPAPPQTTVADIKQQYPDLIDLDDDQVVDAVHEAFYKELPRDVVAAALGVPPRPIKTQKKLGPIDKWRYESCQESAIKSPTPQGVGNGLRICRERFNQ